MGVRWVDEHCAHVHDTHINAHTNTHARVKHTRSHIHNTHINAHTYTHTHARTHTLTYIHMHAHTQEEKEEGGPVLPTADATEAALDRRGKKRKLGGAAAASAAAAAARREREAREQQGGCKDPGLLWCDRSIHCSAASAAAAAARWVQGYTAVVMRHVMTIHCCVCCCREV